jgi:hypothetical protein
MSRTCCDLLVFKLWGASCSDWGWLPVVAGRPAESPTGEWLVIVTMVPNKLLRVDGL